VEAGGAERVTVGVGAYPWPAFMCDMAAWTGAGETCWYEAEEG